MSYISTRNGHSMVIVSTNCGLGKLYNSSDSCVPCPEGYYCPGTLNKLTCPTSQLSLEGSYTLSNCSFELCTNGSKCKFGVKSYCPPGEWRTGSEIQFRACEYGYACINGTMNSCEIGNFFPIGTGYGKVNMIFVQKANIL